MELDYKINEIGVGKHPDNILRDQAYIANFKKLGDSKDNIKVISGFMSPSECNKILSQIDSIQPLKNDEYPMWDERIYSNKEISTLLLPLEKLIQTSVTENYQVGVEISQKPNGIVKFSKGHSMSPHVDDLSMFEYHIAGIVYLNDNYTGGEISFLTQGVTIKPKIGDLVTFPGNLHYAHEVKEILSGDRYSIPTWYKFI